MIWMLVLKRLLLHESQTESHHLVNRQDDDGKDKELEYISYQISAHGLKLEIDEWTSGKRAKQYDQHQSDDITAPPYNNTAVIIQQAFPWEVFIRQVFHKQQGQAHKPVHQSWSIHK